MIPLHTKKLQFEFIPGSHDAALGFGSLRIGIDSSPIWSDPDGRGISWTWIDLLEQLALAWPFLKYEENLPPGAHESALSLLRTGHFASTKFDFEPGVASTRETYVFVRRHNLATGVEGMYLPSLSLLREGRKMLVASENITSILDFNQTIKTISELGEALASHIASGTQDERSRQTIESWRAREPSFSEAAQIQLGSSLWLAKFLPEGQTINSYFEFEPGEDCDESSLLIAARMSDVVPPSSRIRIVELLRKCPPTKLSPLLEEITAEAESKLPNYVQRAHKEGEDLAQWARKKFSIPPEAKADPEELLRMLGVEVKAVRLGFDMIDAVGCWGCRHGPIVLVNGDGKHAQSSAGRRATLAHELAHVLFDRNGSFPAAEVLGGNVPRRPEQRANAFAAEFLLPKKIAADRIRKSTDVVKTIERLPDQFAVSHELAAWQIKNNRPIYDALDSDAKSLVNSWAPSPSGLWFFD